MTVRLRQNGYDVAATFTKKKRSFSIAGGGSTKIPTAVPPAVSRSFSSIYAGQQRSCAMGSGIWVRLWCTIGVCNDDTTTMLGEQSALQHRQILPCTFWNKFIDHKKHSAMFPAKLLGWSTR